MSIKILTRFGSGSPSDWAGLAAVPVAASAELPAPGWAALAALASAALAAIDWASLPAPGAD